MHTCMAYYRKEKDLGELNGFSESLRKMAIHSSPCTKDNCDQKYRDQNYIPDTCEFEFLLSVNKKS